jgi:hypothetical protein
MKVKPNRIHFEAVGKWFILGTHFEQNEDGQQK